MIDVITELASFPALNPSRLALAYAFGCLVWKTISYVRCFMIISADIIARSSDTLLLRKQSVCKDQAWLLGWAYW